MSSVEELKFDLEELKELLRKASRSRVKDLLSAESRKIEGEIQQKTSSEEAQQNAAVSTAAAPKPSTAPVTRTKIDLYAWGQGDKFVNLYVSDKLKDLKGLPAENVSTQFTGRGVRLEISNLNGRNFYFELTKLCYPIVPEESNHKLKSDSIVLNLKKKDQKKWECVTAAEKAAKDKKDQKMKDSMGDVDTKADPSAGLMGMMKKMYEDGDDDMKRTLTKAWYESSQKKGQDPMGMGMGGLDM